VTPRPAADIADGWIHIPHPAAAPGWYRVQGARHAAGWSEFRCGRGIPYVIRSHVELHWSATGPAAAARRPASAA
jgi:hypothetical protein